MGRNTTGPPLRAAPWWAMLRHRGVLQTTTDAKEQNNTAPYTMCRWASNTTGPPLRAAPCWAMLRHRGVLQTTTDAREQNNTAPYTMCRWANNK